MLQWIAFLTVVCAVCVSSPLWPQAERLTAASMPARRNPITFLFLFFIILLFPPSAAQPFLTAAVSNDSRS